MVSPVHQNFQISSMPLESKINATYTQNLFRAGAANSSHFLKEGIHMQQNDSLWYVK